MSETQEIEMKEMNNKNVFSQMHSKLLNSNHPIITVSSGQWSKFRNLENNQQMMAFSFVFICLMAFGILDNLIFGFVCMCYPTWATFASLESNASMWAIYWVVFCWWSLFEYYLPMYNITYYTLIKTLVLYLCFMPQPNTISKITNKYNLTNQLVKSSEPYFEKAKHLFTFFRMVDVPEKENEKSD